jgi:hypothetical protein
VLGLGEINMRASFIAALIAGAISMPALPAFAYDIIIKNHTSFSFMALSAKPGKITDFKTVRPGQDKTFHLDMPKGECKSTLWIVTDDHQQVSRKFEVCGGVIWTFGETSG